MAASLVIQQPARPAGQLILLFHGVGANAQGMAPLGQAMASHFPQAMVVCVESPHASDLGAGFQWFSVVGVTEDNRPARIAAAMPGFQAEVRHWQALAQTDAAHTTLMGFSQGAIMALESTQQPGDPLAGRVVAWAGRFAQPPQHAPHRTAVHLIHGEQDPVIQPAHSLAAAQQLQALNAQVTLDRVPGLGHGVDAQALGCALKRMADLPVD
jgi:phospholipase/carboxylesterase